MIESKKSVSTLAVQGLMNEEDRYDSLLEFRFEDGVLLNSQIE